MILRRLLGRGGGPERDPPRPEALTYAVGDVHGCRAALQAMFAAIEEDAGDAPHRIVMLGDYVDRGPDSAGVLHDLLDRDRRDRRVTCLAGNHDRMMLRFLEAPEDGARWLFIGGQETLASFGVPFRIADAGGEDGLAGPAEALKQALGPAVRGWLARRPLWWRSGDLVAVHALTDPVLPMEAQDEETLLWARPGRDLVPRTDGAWVVHGHTVVDAPRIRAGHVAIDTGAFRGGPLTAAAFAPGEAPRFLQVPGLPD